MSYVKLGVRDYELLEWFHNRYEFGISECIAMLNGKGYANHAVLKEFKKGEFKIISLETGKTTAERINSCADFFPLYKKRTFVNAMISVMKDKTFKWKTFYQRLQNNSSKLKNQGSRNDFIINIERLYNHGTSVEKKVRLSLYDK